MELLYEILFEIYLELMMLIVPEEKAVTKEYRVIAVFVATVALFGILALLIWGCVLLFEEHNPWGFLPFFAAIILSAIQVVVGFRLHYKNNFALSKNQRRRKR